MKKNRLFMLWVFAFAIGLGLDRAVSTYMHSSGIARTIDGKWWAQVIKEPGQFRFTFCVAVVLIMLRQINPQQALFIILAGVLSGSNVLVKWMVGRTRPYKLPGLIQPRPFELHPFFHGLGGLMKETNLCFPSGHACTASALMASIMIVWPKGSWIFMLLALLVGVERFCENAHYVSDVIGAVGLGVGNIFLLDIALSPWMKTINPKSEIE